MTIIDFSGSNPSDWIEALPEYQKATVNAMLDGGSDYEEVAGSWLSRVGPQNTYPFGASARPQDNFGIGVPSTQASYISSVKSELSNLICGDSKYEGIRNQVAEMWNKDKMVIVSTITAAIANFVGVAAAALMPVVALLLALISKVGTSAWCSLYHKPYANSPE
jgi:hypothetical protein